MLAELRRILRSAGVYAVGDLGIRAVGILLLPLYAAYLTPREYGILSVATAVAGLASVVFLLGLNGAVVRFYYELGEPERREFYGTLWATLLIVPAILLTALEVLRGWPLSRLLDQVPYEPYLRLAIWGAFAGAALLTLPLEVFRASDRPGAYVALHASQAVLGVVLAVVFVAVLRGGAVGALWARVIASVAVGLVGAWVLRKHIRARWHWPDLARALVYALPLLPHFLSHWALTASDRIVLERYVSLADVGMYSIGYQIGSIMMLFVIAGNNAMFPLFGRLDPNDGGQVKTLVRIVTYFIAVMAVLSLAVSLFAGEIIAVLAPAYSAAALVVPWVVLGHLFIALYMGPINTISLIVGRTTWVPLFTGAAALTNIALNLLLVPRYGFLAAAMTTAVSYGVMFALVFRHAQGLRPLPYEYRRVALILAAAGAAYALGVAGRLGFPAGRFAVEIAALALFPILLWVSGFPSSAERLAVSRAQLGLFRRMRPFGHRPG
jgi:O-antigen/teichoic acid export membrane protein